MVRTRLWKLEYKANLIVWELVMGRAWNFRASGGLGLLCIGPRAGRAFLYRASGFIRAFLKYEIYLNYRKKRPNIFFKIFFSLFCPMFDRNFGQNSSQNSAVSWPRPKPKFKQKNAPKMSNFLPKLGRKSADFRPEKARRAFGL